MALAILGIFHPIKSSAAEINEKAKTFQAEQIYSAQLTTKAKSLIGSHQGQCVVAVRKFLGVGRSEISGMAKNTKTNSEVPKVGAIVKLKESKFGHVGVVLKIEDNKLLIYESNYNWHGTARTRWIKTNYNRIQGYRIVLN